jgi:hypothetical protein
MKIRKASLMIKDDDGVHYHVTMDVIEYEGEFWLVPEWLDNQLQKATMPLRIISLRTMTHHQMAGMDPEFVVEWPVPKYVFDGRIPPEEASKYRVIESPGIRIQRDTNLH